MLLMLSGEGPTDLGKVEYDATGEHFCPGPMALLVDRLVEERLGYSCLENVACRYVSKQELGETIKAKRRLRPMLLDGHKQSKGTMCFVGNARALALIAMETQEKEKSPVLAVLFRDTDPRSNDNASRRQEEKLDSIRRGFQIMGFEHGVGMVPCPTSEAWVLCCHQDHANCSGLEELPSNPSSPNAIKKRLGDALGGNSSREAQCECVQQRLACSDWREHLKTMPSFAAFEKDLIDVVDKLLA